MEYEKRAGFFMNASSGYKALAAHLMLFFNSGVDGFCFDSNALVSKSACLRLFLVCVGVNG